MAEKKKKKLVVVKGYDSSPYSSTSMGYALVSSPASGRKQCSNFVTCRDTLCDVLRAGALNEACSGHHNPGNDPPMDFSKTRLLMARDIKGGDAEFKKIRDQLFSGKRVINAYERMAGWKPSTITTVNHTSRSHAWLLTGPKEWMHYSHLFSMMCLIMRVALKHGPLEFSKASDLPDMWADMVKRYSDYDVKNWIGKCYKWFPVLMKRHDDIFTQKTLAETYLQGRGNYYSCGGIYSLVSGSTNNPVLTKNIRKIGAEEKLTK
jgi:hypothetical protein